MDDIKGKIEELKNFYNARPEISMAFVFGSYAKNRQISESDVDIAVYFKPAGREIEWEEQKEYPGENKLWVETERILGVDTDLVVLNRAPSGLAADVLRTGVPIIIKDKGLYWDFLFLVSLAAEDFQETIKDWWAIKERSRSLSNEDRKRLTLRVDFLQKELEDIVKFKNISQGEYEQDSSRRRDLERWVENIANASIDIAKIILASKKERLPQTYVDTVKLLGKLNDISETDANKLGEFAKLRNLLAHEYLDLRFVKIKAFLAVAENLYGKLLEFSKKTINEVD